MKKVMGMLLVFSLLTALVVSAQAIILQRPGLRTETGKKLGQFIVPALKELDMDNITRFTSAHGVFKATPKIKGQANSGVLLDLAALGMDGEVFFMLPPVNVKYDKAAFMNEKVGRNRTKSLVLLALVDWNAAKRQFKGNPENNEAYIIIHGDNLTAGNDYEVGNARGIRSITIKNGDIFVGVDAMNTRRLELPIFVHAQDANLNFRFGAGLKTMADDASINLSGYSLNVQIDAYAAQNEVIAVQAQ